MAEDPIRPSASIDRERVVERLRRVLDEIDVDAGRESYRRRKVEHLGRRIRRAVAGDLR